MSVNFFDVDDFFFDDRADVDEECASPSRNII